MHVGRRFLTRLPADLLHQGDDRKPGANRSLCQGSDIDVGGFYSRDLLCRSGRNNPDPGLCASKRDFDFDQRADKGLVREQAEISSSVNSGAKIAESSGMSLKLSAEDP